MRTKRREIAPVPYRKRIVLLTVHVTPATSRGQRAVAATSSVPIGRSSCRTSIALIGHGIRLNLGKGEKDRRVELACRPGTPREVAREVATSETLKSENISQNKR